MIITSDHLGFRLNSASIIGTTYIPKYYNPEIPERLKALAESHDLIRIGDLLATGDLTAETGHEIGKMAYGTGLIPFVRTSDISNWEIKADPKQGVSEQIYSLYAGQQDVQPGDILFVRDGTYLIGAACLVSPYDGKILYQSHILKFRVKEGANISGPLFLAALNAPIVRRQIRAKQFTADIIDTIGNRYKELVLPIPKKRKLCEQIKSEVQETVKERVQLREKLRRVPYWVQGLTKDISTPIPADTDQEDPDEGNVGFFFPERRICSNIYLPRYYNPMVDEEIRGLSSTHSLISLGDLVKKGNLSFDTGIEVGKMVYGTGPVPFIRTSDISNWELKADPKQSIGEDLYEDTKEKLDVRAGDILVVRDGTYLVGTSCILTRDDTKIVYCGGIYKIRVKKPDVLDPYLLLALLNTPVVRRQMRAKQFTRDVIDTLGKRIFEVVIPIPKDKVTYKKIAEATRETIEARAALRNRVRQIALEVEGIERVAEEDREHMEPLS